MKCDYCTAYTFKEFRPMYSAQSRIVTICNCCNRGKIEWEYFFSTFKITDETMKNIKELINIDIIKHLLNKWFYKEELEQELIKLHFDLMQIKIILYYASIFTQNLIVWEQDDIFNFYYLREEKK